MAFVDKLGKMANKMTEVAGETFDYSKAKGKIVLERGKAKEAKEVLGDYVYVAVCAGEELDMERIKELSSQIEYHINNINQLEEEAKKSSEEIANGFK